MEWVQETGRIYAVGEDGKLLAEVTFPEKDGIAQINHTFVDESLRGQGVAGKLLEEVSQRLRKEGKKAVPICSYAVKWFEKHPEYSDLLSFQNFENVIACSGNFHRGRVDCRQSETTKLLFHNFLLPPLFRKGCPSRAVLSFFVQVLI
ncbi:MAG: GNAT family N-acetyltransferase [Neglectibacter timonensis]